MIKNMKLKGIIAKNENKQLIFKSQLWDGTEFTLPILKEEVVFNESLEEKPFVTGWLYVTLQGQQADRCSLTLPKPHERYGWTIVVHNTSLMSSTQSFPLPSRKNSPKAPAPAPVTEVTAPESAIEVPEQAPEPIIEAPAPELVVETSEPAPIVEAPELTPELVEASEPEPITETPKASKKLKASKSKSVVETIETPEQG